MLSILIDPQCRTAPSIHLPAQLLTQNSLYEEDVQDGKPQVTYTGDKLTQRLVTQRFAANP